MKVNELKAGTFLSYLNLAIGSIIPLFYTPIMLRMLGQSEYGIYSLSNSITGYLSLLNFGIGSAIIRYVTKYKVEDNREMEERVIGLFLFIYLLLAILVCFVGIIFSCNAESLFAQGLNSWEIEKLKILIIIMSFSVAISFPISVYSSVIISYEKYIFRKMIDILSSVILPILNLIMLYWGFGSIGVSLSSLFVQVLYAPIFIIYCNRKLKLKINFKNIPFFLLKEIFSYSFFIFLSMIVDLLYWSTDKVLIGAIIGSAAVAIYNIGSVFTSILQNMSSAISNVFVPRITKMVVTNNNEKELSELLIRIGRLQYFIVSLILSGYIVFGQQFIYFWAGKEYSQAYYVALLTMIPLSIPLIQNVAYNVILAQKKHKFRSIIYLIIAIINIVSTYLILPYYGILGAAFCTGIAFIIGNGIIMNVYYYKIIKLDIVTFWKNIIKITIVPVCMIIIPYIIVNFILPWINLLYFLIEVIFYILIFIVLSWLFSMNKYEKNLFLDLIRKFKYFLCKVKYKNN